MLCLSSSALCIASCDFIRFTWTFRRRCLNFRFDRLEVFLGKFSISSMTGEQRLPRGISVTWLLFLSYHKLNFSMNFCCAVSVTSLNTVINSITVIKALSHTTNRFKSRVKSREQSFRMCWHSRLSALNDGWTRQVVINHQKNQQFAKAALMTWVSARYSWAKVISISKHSFIWLNVSDPWLVLIYVHDADGLSSYKGKSLSSAGFVGIFWCD